MKKILSYVLGGIAILASGAASVGCFVILADEPKCPRSMVD